MGKIAFIFAGQGAQYSGMGKELCEVSPAAKAVFDMAEAKREGITALCFEGTKEDLAKTINTQPTVYTVGLAAAAALVEKGIKPDVVAGFSLGELAALSFAGGMSADSAFDFVVSRATEMQICAESTEGTMVAVLGLVPTKVEEICKGQIECYPVNYNCETQTVVSCAKSSADDLVAAVKAEGGKAMKLPVNGAFHSPFMQGAAERLSATYKDMELGKLNVPIYANNTAEPYESVSQIFCQVVSPVLWQKTIENMIADGVDTFIEVGPGKTLTGLMKKINSEVRAFNVENAASLTKALEEL